jgi:nitrite reductase/ring-hydroxylating ferredoxin subunit
MKLPPLDLEALHDLPFPVAHVPELRKLGKTTIDAMGRTLLVLWNGGDPKVYDDACPHLGLPLSLGTLRGGGDRIQCRYHGWTFASSSGEVVDQPTLRKPLPCKLRRRGVLMAGDLVFSWMGDPDAVEHARSLLPDPVLSGFSLFRVVFESPFYMSLFSSVDYAHFPYHTGYQSLYKLYGALGRNNDHPPGTAFPSKVVAEDDRRVTLRIEAAERNIHMYATASEMDDEGINFFQTYVTPISPMKTLYWECYKPRTDSRVLRTLARTAFRVVTTRLLRHEDHLWTGAAAPNFVAGDNIHLTENDAPMGAHLRKFVLPRLETHRAAAAHEGPEVAPVVA